MCVEGCFVWGNNTLFLFLYGGCVWCTVFVEICVIWNVGSYIKLNWFYTLFRFCAYECEWDTERVRGKQQPHNNNNVCTNKICDPNPNWVGAGAELADDDSTIRVYSLAN